MEMLFESGAPFIFPNASGIRFPFRGTDDLSFKIRNYRGEKKRFACFAKQQPGGARQTFLATTYKAYFSALYLNGTRTRTRTLTRLTSTEENGAREEVRLRHVTGEGRTRTDFSTGPT